MSSEWWVDGTAMLRSLCQKVSPKCTFCSVTFGDFGHALLRKCAINRELLLTGVLAPSMH